MHRMKYLYVLFNFFFVVVVVALYTCFVVSIFLLLLSLIALAFSAIVIFSMRFLSVFLVIVVGGLFFGIFFCFVWEVFPMNIATITYIARYAH